MSAIEPVLLGRPVIASSVVPALELLQGASITTKADNIQSYVEAILSLIDSPGIYQNLVSNCEKVRGKFFDPQCSFYAALRKTIS